MTEAHLHFLLPYKLEEYEKEWRDPISGMGLRIYRTFWKPHPKGSWGVYLRGAGERDWHDLGFSFLGYVAAENAADNLLARTNVKRVEMPSFEDLVPKDV